MLFTTRPRLLLGAFGMQNEKLVRAVKRNRSFIKGSGYLSRSITTLSAL